MIVRTTLKEVMSEPLTEEQKKMLEALKDRPVTPDEDCPAYTTEELTRFKRAAEERRARKNIKTVTVKLSPQAFAKAEALGDGYSEILSRFLENALNNREIMKENM